MTDACPNCGRTARMMEMAAEDHVFVGSDATWCVLLSDFFSFATADAEEVPPDQADALYDAWRLHGWPGIAAWVCRRRRQEPMGWVKKELREAGLGEPWKEARNDGGNQQQGCGRAGSR